MGYDNTFGSYTYYPIHDPEDVKKIAELEERVTRQARELDDLREQNRAATLRLAGDTRKFAALREVMETIYS